MQDDGAAVCSNGRRRKVIAHEDVRTTPVSEVAATAVRAEYGHPPAVDRSDASDEDNVTTPRNLVYFGTHFDEVQANSPNHVPKIVRFNEVESTIDDSQQSPDSENESDSDPNSEFNPADPVPITGSTTTRDVAAGLPDSEHSMSNVCTPSKSNGSTTPSPIPRNDPDADSETGPQTPVVNSVTHDVDGTKKRTLLRHSQRRPTQKRQRYGVRLASVSLRGN